MPLLTVRPNAAEHCVMKRKIQTCSAFILQSILLGYFGIALSGGGHDFSFLMLAASPLGLGFLINPYLGWISVDFERSRNRRIFIILTLLGYAGLLVTQIGEAEYGGPYLRKVFFDNFGYYHTKGIFYWSLLPVLIYLSGQVYLWFQYSKSRKQKLQS